MHKTSSQRTQKTESTSQGRRGSKAPRNRCCTAQLHTACTASHQLHCCSRGDKRGRMWRQVTQCMCRSNTEHMRLKSRRQWPNCTTQRGTKP